MEVIGTDLDTPPMEPGTRQKPNQCISNSMWWGTFLPQTGQCGICVGKYNLSEPKAKQAYGLDRLLPGRSSSSNSRSPLQKSSAILRVEMAPFVLERLVHHRNVNAHLVADLVH